MRMIAFVTDEPAIRPILTYFGERTARPEVARRTAPIGLSSLAGQSETSA